MVVKSTAPSPTMRQLIFFHVVLALMVNGWPGASAHHNGTCDVEEEGFRNCLRQFFESKRTTTMRTPIVGNSSAPQEEAERCFVSNGCQKPFFQGQQFEADIERVKGCKQQLRQKTQLAMKECVEKKAPDHTLPSDEDRWAGKDETERRQHYQRWALAKQTQDATICPVSANGEKVRNCLRDAWKRPVDESEKWQRELCNARKDCLKDISPVCQEHMNITRSLKCDCSRERGGGLKQEFYDCINLSASIKDDNQEPFSDSHYCKSFCE